MRNQQRPVFKNLRPMLVVTIVILAVSAAVRVFAATPESHAKAVTVTIYNQGKALVKELRQIAIKKNPKPFEMIFEDVPTTIDPTSLLIKSSSPGFHVLDQNYEYDLINTKNLLDRYIGRKLLIEVPDPKGQGKHLIKEATLIANNDRPIFKFNDQIYIGSYSSIMLGGIPQNLRAKPVLVWLVRNTQDSMQDIEASYIAGDLKWRADYVLQVARDNRAASLSAWVTLENHCGKAFENANLKLVAGQVHQVRPEGRLKELPMLKQLSVPESLHQIKEESFFEYHLYSVPRKVTLKNNQTKQISLFQSKNFSIHRTLKAQNNRPYLYGQLSSGPTTKTHPEIFMEFKNSKKNGLGIPIPKGIVRAYQKSSDGSNLLIGEDRIDHTPKNETISLNMGRAFDITIERKQVSFEEIFKNVYETSWKIEIRNAKDKPDKVSLEECLPGGTWNLISNPDNFQKIAANWISTNVVVPANGKKTVKYTVQVAF